MCRFKQLLHLLALAVRRFQYILCVGSRQYLKVLVQKQTRFNTSYVSVQVSIALVVFFAQSSFNTSYVSVQGYDIKSGIASLSEFQYILCVGSRDCICLYIFFVCLFQYILCVGSRIKICTAT